MNLCTHEACTPALTMSSYYDIDAILAEEERTPVVFNVDGLNLGYLDHETTDEDITEGTKLELPFWMAESLSARKYTSVDTPKCYGHGFRSALRADPSPSVVDLRQRSPYYFQLGVKLGRFVTDDDEQGFLYDSLVHAFTGRYHDILDKSQNSRDEDTSGFQAHLTQLERSLFKAGHKASADFFRWKNRSHQRLRAARVMRGARKRRRAH